MSIKILWRAFTAVIAIVACGYVAISLTEQYQALRGFSWSTSQWLLLGASSLVWVAVLILSGLNWAWILTGMGQENDRWSSTAIFGVSQLGKYLPGNVAHHLGRFVMARDVGMSLTSVSKSMFLEVALSFAIAACFFFLGVYLFDLGGWRDYAQVGRTSQITLIFLTVSLLLFALFRQQVGIVIARFLPAGILSLPPLVTMVKAVAVCSVSYLALGYVLDIHARSLFDYDTSQWLLLTTVFAGAWVIGALMPGAPAGLGVREVVMIATLTPIYGETIAIGLSMSLRAITIAGDCLNFCIWVVWRSLRRGEDKFAASTDGPNAESYRR